MFFIDGVVEKWLEMNKVNRDTRRKGFVQKYGKLYVVELDALLAIVPEELKIIVQESVDGFFDEDVYKEVLSKYHSKSIERLVHERARFLD
jgi:hypothetical protein